MRTSRSLVLEALELSAAGGNQLLPKAEGVKASAEQVPAQSNPPTSLSNTGKCFNLLGYFQAYIRPEDLADEPGLEDLKEANDQVAESASPRL